VRDRLAENLLATVMTWDVDDVARERPTLQAMADYKFDEYEQYAPGMRFIEMLARWLNQFATIEERRAAYRFVREELIFISRAEMSHLVVTAYPDIVRPHLIALAAQDMEIEPQLAGRIVKSQAFKIRQRACLFLGLSDGARIDAFRRANGETLSNEQIVVDYHAVGSKASGLLADLRADLEPFGSAAPSQFTSLVLLDDFSASGISYLRDSENGAGDREGKIARVVKRISDDGLGGLIDPANLSVLVVLYVATDQALDYLEPRLLEIAEELGCAWEVVPGFRLPEEIVIRSRDGTEFNNLIEQYYDPSVEDEHTRKGGTDAKYGFAACGLPVVLTHNAPNNSLALLWAHTRKVRALFPRVRRHREDEGMEAT
jgi:hypothetical protein